MLSLNIQECDNGPNCSTRSLFIDTSDSLQMTKTDPEINKKCRCEDKMLQRRGHCDEIKN